MNLKQSPTTMQGDSVEADVNSIGKWRGFMRDQFGVQKEDATSNTFGTQLHESICSNQPRAEKNACLLDLNEQVDNQDFSPEKAFCVELDQEAARKKGELAAKHLGAAAKATSQRERTVALALFLKRRAQVFDDGDHAALEKFDDGVMLAMHRYGYDVNIGSVRELGARWDSIEVCHKNPRPGKSGKRIFEIPHKLRSEREVGEWACKYLIAAIDAKTGNDYAQAIRDFKSERAGVYGRGKEALERFDIGVMVKMKKLGYDVSTESTSDFRGQSDSIRISSNKGTKLLEVRQFLPK